MRNFFALDPFLARQRSNKLPPPTSNFVVHERHLLVCKNGIRKVAQGETSRACRRRAVHHWVQPRQMPCMESGNWRMKYELRSAYQNDGSAEARCILLALKDSLQTFKEGRKTAQKLCKHQWRIQVSERNERREREREKKSNHRW
jgi:hypothetical protein